MLNARVVFVNEFIRCAQLTIALLQQRKINDYLNFSQ